MAAPLKLAGPRWHDDVDCGGERAQDVFEARLKANPDVGARARRDIADERREEGGFSAWSLCWDAAAAEALGHVPPPEAGLREGRAAREGLMLAHPEAFLWNPALLCRDARGLSTAASREAWLVEVRG